MNAPWPTIWQGQTKLDCGEDGQVMTLVTTSGQPSAIHQKAFQLIAARWHTIWPEFRTAISALMESYKQPQPDWKNARTIHLEIPDAPPAEGAEWSIGVVLSGSDTLWTLPYKGWSPLKDKAQAMW